jgi:hypothetical protein
MKPLQGLSVELIICTSMSETPPGLKLDNPIRCFKVKHMPRRGSVEADNYWNLGSVYFAILSVPCHQEGRRIESQLTKRDEILFIYYVGIIILRLFRKRSSRTIDTGYIQ